MILAFVVQRYGAAVDGGAEYHCRLVAEHLAREHKIEVFTTCATDYITWKNELPSGSSEVHGIPVKRFKVRRPRDPDRFGRLSEKVFRAPHAPRDEVDWISEQGPYAPALVRALEKRREVFDYFIFFSYRYYHSYHGVRALSDKAVLVPTAEKDEVISLAVFKPFFHVPRAIVYNSVEEREMILQESGNHEVPGDVVGVGVEAPDSPDSVSPFLFREKHGFRDRYVIFIGRVDPNKGCRQLFNFFGRYRDETRSDVKLLLVGGRTMEIPEDPAIVYAGFLSEREKWSALAGAELLIMPSELESLSMVTLEAWALGKPVLVNGRCDVLRGQSRRSNAGLYYETYYEFREALALLEKDDGLRGALGRNGRRYFLTNYHWDVIGRKYDQILHALSRADAVKPEKTKHRAFGLLSLGRG